MSDGSRREAAELSRDLRYARHALGHDVEAPPTAEPGRGPLRGDADVRAWFHARRDQVLAVLGQADAETAAALLAEVWPVVPPDADDAWCRRLYDVGVGLAAALPDSPALATALRRGARSLRARGAHRLAAALGMYELAIHRRRDDDPDATAAALADLAATYRAQGLLHEVVDCLDEALEVHLRHGRPAGVARSLAELGAVMLEAGRVEAAIDHLLRADKAFEEAADQGTANGRAANGSAADRRTAGGRAAGATAADTARRAECLALLGRAWWLSGDEPTAHRAFNRALAVLVGLDDAETGRVRDLVTRLRAAPPEPDEPGEP